MKAKQKRFSVVIAIAVALSILMVSASAVISAEEATLMAVPLVPETKSVHESIDITEITGEVVEPPMLTSAASSIAKEKEWYEYVYYSPTPVSYCYLDDNTRLSFYDPYDYSSSLVMEVDDSLTDWSSNNSMQVSYTEGQSINDTTGKSDETITTTHFGYKDSTTTTTGPSTVETVVKNNTDEYNTSKTVTTDNSTHWGSSETVKIGNDVFVSGEVTLDQSWVSGDVETKVVSTDAKGRVGYTESTNTTTVTNGEQKTTVVNDVAKRVVKATGHVENSFTSEINHESTTYTKTYDAVHFNEKGTPYQWKIIKYTVKVPMFYQIEYLIDGEWIYGDSNYCTINTIQGTCRAWLQNNVAYYEHWGTGEPVTWDEFWSQFFTEDQLVAAYKNRLYPDF